jgi:hypothetical protein
LIQRLERRRPFTRTTDAIEVSRQIDRARGHVGSFDSAGNKPRHQRQPTTTPSATPI